MPRQSVRTEEIAAGEIVAQQVGGEPIERDVPGAPDGTHDLDIRLHDDRWIALEVTSAADSSQLSMYATGFGNRWDAPSLSTDWRIGIASDAIVDIKKLMGGVEPHLKVLEEHGITEVGRVFSTAWRSAGHAVAEATQQILMLGAILARSMNPPRTGEAAQLLLSGHGPAGSDPGQVNKLVAERAKAKVKKLLAASADERHLFVWIDSSHADAELAMFSLPPPASAPSLPDGIDAVWAATIGKVPGALFERLWCVRRPGTWEAIAAKAQAYPGT